MQRSEALSGELQLRCQAKVATWVNGPPRHKSNVGIATIQHPNKTKSTLLGKHYLSQQMQQHFQPTLTGLRWSANKLQFVAENNKNAKHNKITQTDPEMYSRLGINKMYCVNDKSQFLSLTKLQLTFNTWIVSCFLNNIVFSTPFHVYWDAYLNETTGNTCAKKVRKVRKGFPYFPNFLTQLAAVDPLHGVNLQRSKRQPIASNQSLPLLNGLARNCNLGVVVASINNWMINWFDTHCRIATHFN